MNNGDKALVLDDNPGTRTRVQAYLEMQGHDVVQADTLKKAQDCVRTMPDLTRIVSDMDLTSTGAGFLSYVAHRFDGFRFLKWLHLQQQEGRYSNIRDVTLHSTTLNGNDKYGSWIRPITDYIKKRVDRMDKTSETSYTAQPKTVILGNGKK